MKEIKDRRFKTLTGEIKYYDACSENCSRNNKNYSEDYRFIGLGTIYSIDGTSQTMLDGKEDTTVNGFWAATTMKGVIKTIKISLECKTIDDLAKVLGMRKNAIFKAQNTLYHDHKMRRYRVIEVLLKHLSSHPLTFRKCLAEIKQLSEDRK